MKNIFILIFLFSSAVMAKGPATSNIFSTGLGVAQPGFVFGLNPSGVMYNNGVSLVAWGWQTGTGSNSTPWSAGLAAGGGRYGGSVLSSGTSGAGASSSTTSTSISVGADLSGFAMGLSSSGSGSANTLGIVFNNDSKNRIGLTATNSAGSTNTMTAGLGYAYVTSRASIAIDMTNTASTKSGLYGLGFSVYGDKFQIALNLSQSYSDPAAGATTSATDSTGSLGFLIGSSGLLMLQTSNTSTHMLGFGYTF